MKLLSRCRIKIDRNADKQTWFAEHKTNLIITRPESKTFAHKHHTAIKIDTIPYSPAKAEKYPKLLIRSRIKIDRKAQQQAWFGAPATLVIRMQPIARINIIACLESKTFTHNKALETSASFSNAHRDRAF